MNIGCRRPAILLLSTAWLCVAQRSSDFAGTWVFQFNGQAIFTLRLSAEKAGISGALTRPAQLTFSPDGDVTEIGADQVTLPIQKSALRGKQLELTIDRDRYVLGIEGPNRASLVTQGMRAWHLERAAGGEKIVLATHLAEPDYRKKSVPCANNCGPWLRRIKKRASRSIQRR